VEYAIAKSCVSAHLHAAIGVEVISARICVQRLYPFYNQSVVYLFRLATNLHVAWNNRRCYVECLLHDFV
jgi:hypothetical protein